MSRETFAESPAPPELSLGDWFALSQGEPGELVDDSDAKLALTSGRGRKPGLTVYLSGSRRPEPG